MSTIYMYPSHTTQGMIHLSKLTQIGTDLTNSELSELIAMLPPDTHDHMPYVIQLHMDAMLEGSTRVLINNMSYMPYETVQEASRSNLPCNHHVKRFVHACARLGLCINKCIHIITS
jgi:hypothetical protein